MRERPLILLIDDEQAFLEIATVKLESEGYDTVQTHSGKELLERAMSDLPDLVLSDIYMYPGPSGWECALELRRNPKTKHIKIAFFTSLSDPWLELQAEDREKVATELEGVVFFSKTDDVELLGKRVRDLLT